LPAFPRQPFQENRRAKLGSRPEIRTLWSKAYDRGTLTANTSESRRTQTAAFEETLTAAPQGSLLARNLERYKHE
jgi:hypothetical protein